MLHTLRFFFSSSKCRLFHNAAFFGSCIIHNLNTGLLKFKRKFLRLKVKLARIVLFKDNSEDASPIINRGAGMKHTVFGPLEEPNSIPEIRTI
jgi:hypothetical protein